MLPLVDGSENYLFLSRRRGRNKDRIDVGTVDQRVCTLNGGSTAVLSNEGIGFLNAPARHSGKLGCARFADGSGDLACNETGADDPKSKCTHQFSLPSLRPASGMGIYTSGSSQLKRRHGHPGVGAHAIGCRSIPCVRCS
jgi:hypothetical protein